jgi:hypothetical protein
MWVLCLALTARSAEPSVSAVEPATRVLQQVRAQYTSGLAQAEDVHTWSVRVLEPT